MAKTFRDYDQDQSRLLPLNMNDWLPADHLARFVNDAVESLDIGQITRFYEGEERGQPPYHPRLMLKLLVYGYCVNVRSSRRLEAAVQERLDFRYLTANTFPKHSAIGEFRRIHLAAFHELFVQFLGVAQSSGLLKVGVVAMDGTRLRANASLRRNYKMQVLRRKHAELDKIVRDILNEAERLDHEEDEALGSVRGNELPPELRDATRRRSTISEAIKSLERERQIEIQEQEARIEERRRIEESTGEKTKGAWPSPPDTTKPITGERNTTDPDSRPMKTRNEYIQGYNAQAAVDARSHFIVGTLVTNKGHDYHMLNPMLDEIHQNLGTHPPIAVLDAGCYKRSDIERAPPNVDLFIAQRGDRDEREDNERPPRGRIPTRLNTNQRMARKLRTKRGRKTYALRGRTVEPRFGIIKTAMGIREFLLRGLNKVRAEWDLIALSHNIRRAWTYQPIPLNLR